jgi:WD40 repeat protein
LSFNGYVASSSKDKTVNIWDPNTWNSICVYKGHTQTVNGLDQIDKDTLVSGSYDQTIRIWKISTCQTIKIISTSANVFTVRVLSNRFQKQQIACGLSDTGKTSRINIYEQGDLIKTLISHTASVTSIEILSEQLIASGSWDYSVVVWDLNTYSVKFKLLGHRNGVNCVKKLSFNLMASGEDKGMIIIWDWLTGDLVYSLKGHTMTLWLSSLYLFDEKTLISGSQDKSIKVWDISSGQLLQTINTDLKIYAIDLFKTRGIKKNIIKLF